MCTKEDAINAVSESFKKQFGKNALHYFSATAELKGDYWNVNFEPKTSVGQGNSAFYLVNAKTLGVSESKVSTQDY